MIFKSPESYIENFFNLLNLLMKKFFSAIYVLQALLSHSSFLGEKVDSFEYNIWSSNFSNNLWYEISDHINDKRYFICFCTSAAIIRYAILKIKRKIKVWKGFISPQVDTYIQSTYRTYYFDYLNIEISKNIIPICLINTEFYLHNQFLIQRLVFVGSYSSVLCNM